MKTVVERLINAHLRAMRAFDGAGEDGANDPEFRYHYSTVYRLNSLAWRLSRAGRTRR